MAFNKKDFDLVQIKSDEDIERLMRTSDIIYLQKDGEFYVYDYYQDIAVTFFNSKWTPCPSPSIEEEDYEYLDYDEFVEIFKDNLPYDALKEAEQDAGEDRKKYYETLIKETPLEVVGWLPLEKAVKYYTEDRTDEAFAAIVKDIRENDYYFMGNEAEEIGIVPILSDNTFYTYSYREFGEIMAVAQKKYGFMDYTKYMHHHYDPKHTPRFPKVGLYKDTKKK